MVIRSKPEVVPLQKAREPRFGGKAHGLAKLIDLGLTVPTGFVVAADGAVPVSDDIERAFSELAVTRVAVRSSATCEDGAGASAAGQFDTVLGVESLDDCRLLPRWANGGYRGLRPETCASLGCRDW